MNLNRKKIFNKKIVPNDPSTWTPNELKEWLAEHRVSYKGIPDKQELLNLVKTNWQDVKEQANSTTEAVESFVTKYVNTIKDSKHHKIMFTAPLLFSDIFFSI